MKKTILPTLNDYSEQFLLPEELMLLADEAFGFASTHRNFAMFGFHKGVMAAAAVYCAVRRHIEKDLPVGDYCDEQTLTIEALSQLSLVSVDDIMSAVTEMNGILGWW